MADTLRDIGAQMANVMSNLAQRPGDALTGDHVATMDSLRKQWDAAVRATPPSPSTAPEGCAWLPLEPTEAMVHAAEDLPAPRMFGKVWRAMAGAALASRPAEVDDEGLPPLLSPEFCAGDLESGEPVYTAEQYRQGQRDAVASYKRKQAALQELADQAQENGMGYGGAVAADRARREKGGE